MNLIYRVELGWLAWERLKAALPKPATEPFWSGGTTAGTLAAWALHGMPVHVIYAMHERAWQIVDYKNRTVNAGRLTSDLYETITDVGERFR